MSLPDTCPHCDAGPGPYVNSYLCGTYMRAGVDTRKHQTKRCTVRERTRLAARVAELENCIEGAWGIIANVSRGNWTEQHPEWQEAAIKWRDRYVITRHASMAQDGGAR